MMFKYFIYIPNTPKKIYQVLKDYLVQKHWIVQIPYSLT